MPWVLKTSRVILWQSLEEMSTIPDKPIMIELDEALPFRFYDAFCTETCTPRKNGRFPLMKLVVQAKVWSGNHIRLSVYRGFYMFLPSNSDGFLGQDGPINPLWDPQRTARPAVPHTTRWPRWPRWPRPRLGKFPRQFPRRGGTKRCPSWHGSPWCVRQCHLGWLILMKIMCFGGWFSDFLHPHECKYLQTAGSIGVSRLWFFHSKPDCCCRLL